MYSGVSLLEYVAASSNDLSMPGKECGLTEVCFTVLCRCRNRIYLYFLIVQRSEIQDCSNE